MRELLLILASRITKSTSGFITNLLVKLFERIIMQAYNYYLHKYAQKKAQKQTETEREIQKKYEDSLKDGVSEHELEKNTEDFLNGRNT